MTFCRMRGCAFCNGMQVIGLELFRRDTFQQERQHCHAVTLCQFWIQGFEAGGIIQAVIRRQLHAEQQHLGSAAARLLDECSEVGFDVGDGRAAQAIIGAEFEDDDAWLMLAQGCLQASQPAGGGLAADAGVDDLILWVGALQLLLQQVHPARFARDAVGSG